MDHLSYTPDYWIQNKEICLENFKDEENWNSVPCVNFHNLHELKDNTLVRFHGMIQDMHNPEYYYEEYEIENQVTKERSIRFGKYTDTTNLAEDEVIDVYSNRNKMNQLQTIVVISFPGLNNWVRNIEIEGYKSINLSESKKPTNTSLKRPADDDVMDVDSVEIEQHSVQNRGENKKLCKELEPENKSVLSHEHLLNFPVPDNHGKCCYVKIYEDDSFDFKLNDMVDIIGFLSVDPKLSEIGLRSNDAENSMELQTHNPPPSLIPRIHCVSFKKLQYYNPLLKTIHLENESFINLRKELSLVLTQLLFGDMLAAEYFIFHLVSSVYLRKELMVIGKFTLNISNVPVQTIPTFGEQLYEFLQMLIPKSYYLPMTLENMNEKAFLPKKDYECDRLTSGLLQLSNNTHLVLDETRLQPGQLGASGCQSVSALATTVRKQSVHYDFNYYQMEFDCDIPILILSEGASLLPSDFHIPLQVDEENVNTFSEIVEAAKHFLKPELLDNLRVYLTKCRHADYNLSDADSEFIQNEFVKLRSRDKKITAEDLHQYLVLARLMSVTMGKNYLDEECWKKILDMETERKLRLTNRPKRK